MTTAGPPDEQRCHRRGRKEWRCNGWKLENSTFCQKHKGNGYDITPIIEEKEDKAFTEGQKVEVVDDDQGLRDAWFPAKIIQMSRTRARKILVEYDTLFVDDKGSDQLREVVDFSRVRPLPPSLPACSFQQSAIVDAFYDGAWWKGKIITVYGNSTCMVHFPFWKERKKFEVDQLRGYQEWVGGRWICPQVENVANTGNGQQSQIGETSETIDIANESCKRKMDTEQISLNSPKQKKFTSSNTTDTSSVEVQTLRASSDHLSPSSSQQKSSFLNCARSTYNFRERRKSSLSPLSEVGALGGPSRTQPPVHDQTKWNSVIFNQQRLQVATRLSKEMGSEEDPRCTPCGEAKNGIKRECAPGCPDLTIIEDAPALHVASPHSEHVTPFKEVTNGVQTELALKDTEFTTIAPSGESHPLKGSFLFEKSSTMWGDLDKTNVLRLMPQNPHFSPLSEINEYLREGIAIGYMHGFVSMVEKVRKITLNEVSIVTVDDYLEGLKDFEAMGFDVDSIRARLNKLQTVSIRLGELENESTQVKEKIIKDKAEEESLKRKCEENDKRAREITEAIAELKEKRQKLVMEKQVKCSGIIAIQKILQEVKQEICEVEVKFLHSAACPW